MSQTTKTIYVDNAATTAACDEAIAAMTPYLKTVYGNPSSLHTAGQIAKEALENARARIAAHLNADAGEIYFTSGGSEADNQALRSAAANGLKRGKKHIITTAFEHHAVLHPLKKLEREGFEVTYLDVHENGIVTPEQVREAIRPDTALVTIMFANNEIGTIQPIAEIGAICRANKVVFHTDAVQAVGHVPIDVKAMNIDMLSLSAHKFHGAKGVGALYVRRGVPLNTFIDGGAQEKGRRAGTENLAGIAAMAAALDYVCGNMESNAKRLSALRDKIIKGLSTIPHSKLNGDRTNRLPSILNMCFEGIEGESLLLLLDDKGICASSGSACTSGSLDPSHVLLALGLPHEVAHGSLRISLSEDNTDADAEYIIKSVAEVVEYLRGMSPVWEALEKGEKPHLL
ncbi:MAG: cysteine desulfurase NifS [Clostridiales bacterium]|nr:cysteine desulfurase NifS [Clostridiales bacterium]